MDARCPFGVAAHRAGAVNPKGALVRLVRLAAFVFKGKDTRTMFSAVAREVADGATQA